MPGSKLAIDLIDTARDLIVDEYPRQSNLKRAVSTTYYALFHCMSQNCADSLVDRDHAKAAWMQVYRSLNHRQAKTACDKKQKKVVLAKFPLQIQHFAEQFRSMQILREDADYDVDSQFVKGQVETAIDAAHAAITDFEACPEADRKAFSIWVLIRERDKHS